MLKMIVMILILILKEANNYSARCEFRGGIEEYLQAASSVMADNGIFVVCENWLNNDRVYSGAKSAGLRMKQVYPIKGKYGRKENLFGVYVLVREVRCIAEQEENGIVAEPLSVRTSCGKWTLKYADLLETMSIPANHDAK
jgi:tRNA1(Val) A37 N6-methylase TrmN6